MAQLRSICRATVRTPARLKSGSLDNGVPWQFHEVEVIDEDQNKSVVRVHDSLAAQLKPGETYDFVVDSTFGSGVRARCEFVALRQPAAAR